MPIAAVARKIILFLVAGFSLFLLDRIARNPRPHGPENPGNRKEAGRASKRILAGGSLGAAAFLAAWLAGRFLSAASIMTRSVIPYEGILLAAALGFAVGSLISLLSTGWNQ